ncbi:hypothetical protein L2K70_00760 [Nocardioides KLBMP 9356]|uniref:Uncharacterized protein n=1 Tax=Nocardioides potassii TaxID=2911371 RepID=A0ABS9H7F3_9ACTN|nr:hypothetical protein [Nocardioides potassii]MCF6376130.1 hypothetical protein [Nocardioides potassii]
MSKPTEQRPPQVTLASGIVVFSSVVVLLTVWDRLSTLRSLDTQEAIRDALAQPPFSGFGLDVQSASDLLRWVMAAVAVAACATAILGWYVRKPDRSARLGLSIFAVPVFVGGLTVGGLAGSFVAAGAAMLWLSPGREWFATGRWTPPDPRSESSTRDVAPRRTPFPSAPPQQRPATQLPPHPHHPTHAPHAPGWQPQRHDLHRAGPHSRPAAMVAAFVITVVMAGGLLTMSLLWVAIAGLSPEFLRSVMAQQPELFDEGVGFEQVRDTVLAFASGFIVWCLAALVLAGFAMARRDWARRGLTAIAALSAVGCLFFVLDTVLVVLPAMAAVATVVCLRRVEVRRWFELGSR